MQVNLPTQLKNQLESDAVSLGIPLENLIVSALHFYFVDKVSDTNKRIAYSTSETAEMIGVSTKTILRLVARGLLKPLPDSTRRYIFSEKEIERYVAEATGRTSEKVSPTSRRKQGKHTRRH
jgi:hypothetical protein